MRAFSGVRGGIAFGGLALLALGCADQRTTEVARVPQVQRSVALASLAQTQELGKFIFNDMNLSLNRNQSCAACHALAWGGTGPDQAINAHGAVYEGSVAGSFGDRKPPSSAYATISPVLAYDKQSGWVGGNFWDGRATGFRLGNPAMEQAQGPFLNPKEQALPDAACVVYRVSTSSYGTLYRTVFGDKVATIVFPQNTDALCSTMGGVVPLSDADRAKVSAEYDNVARAIAAWEGSPEVSAYSSKFDAWKAGVATLSADEQKGWALFNGKGKCARCHVPRGPKAAFTDFTYDNLGVPKNPENPATVANPGWADPGLGGFLASSGLGPSAPQLGKFKVPTLRNVDLRPVSTDVKAYMHNGVFKSLLEVVHFYNTRDVLPKCEVTPSPAMGVNCWPAPETAQNINTTELGNLGLSEAEEKALVAFMTALSDGYVKK